MTDIERSLTYLEAQVKYLMQRDAEREGSAVVKRSLTTDPVEKAYTLLAYNAKHPEPSQSRSEAMDEVQRLGQEAEAKQPEPGDLVFILAAELARTGGRVCLEKCLRNTGLRLVRDLDEEERRELAGKVYAEFVYGSNPDFTDTDLAHAAIDAALGPVKS